MSEENFQILKRLSDEIESLALNDKSAWHGIAEQIRHVTRTVGDEPRALDELLQLCLMAVDSLASGTSRDAMTLVDKLAECFSAAEMMLLEHPDRDKLVHAATAELREALPGSVRNSIPTTSPEYDGSPTEPPPPPTLDDLATHLIQLDPADKDGISTLQRGLEHLSRLGSFPEAARQILVDAARLADGIVKGRFSAIESAFTELGLLLENAQGCLDEAVEPDASPAPDGGAGDETKVRSVNQTDRTEPEPGSDPDATAAQEQARDYMPEDSDPDLIGEFITESEDLIVKAEEALLSLETDPEDSEAVGTVFRAFHTVKGTSAFLELTLIAELGHHAESLLSRVRDGEIRYSGGYADLCLRALDMIKELTAAVHEALGGGLLLKPAGYDELMAVLKNPEAAGVSESASDESLPRVGDLLVAQGKAQREKIEAAITDHNGEHVGMAVVKSKAASLTDVGQALRTQSQMRTSRKAIDTSVRVSTQRLDRLIDMVGELVIAHSMVAQDELVLRDENHQLLKKVTQASKIVRELQDMSMSLRMVPLKATFNKMARLVRDVARKVNKSVKLVTEGEDTEIDRNLVDIINDPLIHMVRNAVDHGIEAPEERQKLGKPPSGEVKLSAYHSAGNVVVEISDDGKGLNRQAILEKARERELITNGSALSDKEVFSLIFEPGFSTAETVTDVSGRGVGMDVVKKNIESLRGQAEIASEPGKGSVFKMSLPLTLAIIDGMVVRVGKETYVIPTVSIVRSIKPEVKNLSTVVNRGEMLSLQGRLIPLFRLARLFNCENGNGSKAIEDTLVVVVEDDDKQAGLIIDELIGRQQVVIKSLGETMRDIPGISGGAIMPNGRVGLILDVGGLVKFATA